jgi:hypothetical protein
MRLRVSNPALIPDLLEFLRSRVDVVAEEVSVDEVDVSLVGVSQFVAERKAER